MTDYDTDTESGRNPVSKHGIQPECGAGRRGTGRANQSRGTDFSGPERGREGKILFPVKLSTSRIGMVILLG